MSRAVTTANTHAPNENANTTPITTNSANNTNSTLDRGSFRTAPLFFGAAATAPADNGFADVDDDDTAAASCLYGIGDAGD